MEVDSVDIVTEAATGLIGSIFGGVAAVQYNQSQPLGFYTFAMIAFVLYVIVMYLLRWNRNLVKDIWGASKSDKDSESGQRINTPGSSEPSVRYER